MENENIQPQFSQDEIKIQTHEYSLRQFIDMAVRYKIDGVYATVTKGHEFSMTFEYFINNLRANFENFRAGLKNELNKTENWKAHKIDIEKRFLPEIEHYFKWYAEHKEETKKFNPYNPYELMYENMISTKQEILNYFPEQENEQIKNMSPKNILPTRKSVEDLQTLTLTTQKQTALFAYYLRKEKLLLPNLSNTLLAKCFGEMNDYSPQQIQKLFDGAKNVSDISQKKEDFQILISALQKLKDEISRELSENIKSKTVK